MSIIDPITCGFAKIYCYNTFTNTNITVTKQEDENEKEFKSRILHQRFEEFCKTFAVVATKIEYDQLKKFNNIVKNVQDLGKSFPNKKKHLLDIFSKKKNGTIYA